MASGAQVLQTPAVDYNTRSSIDNEHEYLRKNVDPIIMPIIEKLVLYQPDNVFEFMQRYLAGEPLGPARYAAPRGLSRSLPAARRRKMASFMAEKVLPVMEEFTQRVVYERPEKVKDFVHGLVSMQINTNGFPAGTKVQVYSIKARKYHAAVIQEMGSHGKYTVSYTDHPERIETESDVDSARIKAIQTEVFQEGDSVDCFVGSEKYTRGSITKYFPETGTYTVQFENSTVEQNVAGTRLRRVASCNNTPPERMNSVILMIGLDGAGKSTLLSSLQGDTAKEHTPSVGFTSVSFELSNGKTTFYDLGGGPSIRSVWKEYYADAHGILFVVDSTDDAHLAKASRVMNDILQDSQLAGKPILLFANKQDSVTAKSAKDVQAAMNFPAKQVVKALPCIAKPSANKNFVDERLEVGLTWLFQEIESNYVVLNERVHQDTQKKKIAYAQKIADQKKRVQAWVEERERSHMSAEDKPMHQPSNEKTVDGTTEPEQETPEEDDEGPKCSNCNIKPATTRCAASKWTPVCDECLASF